MPCTSENQNLQLGPSLRSTTISTAPIFIQQQSTDISITLILIPKNYQQPNVNSSQLLKRPHSLPIFMRWPHALYPPIVLILKGWHWRLFIAKTPPSIRLVITGSNVSKHNTRTG